MTATLSRWPRALGPFSAVPNARGCRGARFLWRRVGRPWRTLLAVVALGGVAVGPAEACSSFFVAANGEMIFGNTLDWHTEEGLIFLNKRNVTKRGLSWFPGAPVWTSRYASLTLNQWGRDFPSRGMNEAGLVFGEMTLNATRYPDADSRAPMENNQWVQYMLDTCATVEEVLAADRRVRINTDQYSSHYLFADRNGHALSMEWLNGQLVYHTGETMPFAVLTNDTYDNLLAAYRANPLPVPGSASAARFNRAVDLMTRYNPATDGSVADRVFAILDSVQNPGWTKWKLAFDVRRGRLLFHTYRNAEFRYVEMGRFDFSGSAPVQMLDVNAALSGDVTGAFVDYSTSANREVVIIAANKMGYGIDPPWLRDFYNYPATTSAAVNDPSITGVRDLVPGARTILSAASPQAAGASCQWQIDTGTGWRDLHDGADPDLGATTCSGAGAASLQLANATASLDGAHVRCVATHGASVNPSPASRLTVALPPAVSPVPVTWCAPVPLGDTAVLTASTRFVNGNPGYTYGWRRNGVALAGASNATLTLANLQPAEAGLYTASVTGATTSASLPVIVGLGTAAKVIGAGEELAPNLTMANGNVCDQVLLRGIAASITADAGQVTRISYVDLTDDIVQVEFGGAGTLTLVLDQGSGPAAATNYNQPSVAYMKGHAGIVITGADETTNLSVFSVGRRTSANPALFRDEVPYDGVADLAFMAVSSAVGRCGSIRAANVDFYAARGSTGIYAPGVAFRGPVYVGELCAFDTATPMLVLGSADDVRITGGDLFQENGQPVEVSGIAQLRFTAGSDSHGNIRPSPGNLGILRQGGVDVTQRIVVHPPSS